jgi:hypothetical protein
MKIESQLKKTDRGREEMVETPGKDGKASMTEQVKRHNPWRKMMTMN